MKPGCVGYSDASGNNSKARSTKTRIETLYICKHQKAQNENSKARSTKTRIETEINPEQAVRDVDSKARSTKTRIETYFSYCDPTFKNWIRKQDPLKQGLKLLSAGALELIEYSKARSTKTRIETWNGAGSTGMVF